LFIVDFARAEFFAPEVTETRPDPKRYRRAFIELS
jgi:hypothetical protein